jgi:predicted phosphodiesterase
MRIGIFSDVHGNIEALSVVLAELERRGAKEYVCLGDILGYGADPGPCIKAIRARAKITILGNHDAAGAGRMNLEEYYIEAREAIIYAWSRIDDDERQWIKELPYAVRDGDILYSHGAPHAPELFEYLFSEEQLDEYCRNFADLPAVTFIGHSHLCVGFALTPTMVAGFVEEQVKIEPGHKYVLTVGSVGQPRDRDNRACAVIYDTDEQLVTYVRVPYDIPAAQKKILDAGLPRAFAARLQLGI